jgi:hypothetical protein
MRISPLALLKIGRIEHSPIPDKSNAFAAKVFRVLTEPSLFRMILFQIIIFGFRRSTTASLDLFTSSGGAIAKRPILPIKV